MEPGIFTPPISSSPSTPNGGARRLTRGSTIHPATLFIPQDATLTPEAHFPLQVISGPNRPPFPRFINRFDSREMLLVVDDSCLNNGRHRDKLREPVAGCSFLFKGASSTITTSSLTNITTTANTNPPLPRPDQHPHHHHHHHQQPPPPEADPTHAAAAQSGSISFPLERQGPAGTPTEHTSNRAKLRAVLAALQFRAWGREGWRRVVVLTDLAYVVWGAMTWLPRWVARGWRRRRSGGGGGSGPLGVRRRGGKGRGRRRGDGVGYYRNRDLWEALQQRVDELRGEECEVAFWLVPRERERDRDREEGGGGGTASPLIARAKAAAQAAARAYSGEPVDKFEMLFGVWV